MSKKGRRGRSRREGARRAESAPVSLDATVALRPSDGAQTPAPEAPSETPAPAPLPPVETKGSAPEAELPAPASAAEPAASTAVIDVRPLEAVEPSQEPPATSSLAESLEPEREPDATPPPVSDLDDPPPPGGDLDGRFFADTPTEAWLAHELERRDPRLLRKMAASVALRRARLARYVVGVVAVAVVLCLAALIKSAVPAADDATGPGYGAEMPVPAAQPTPLPLPSAAPGAPAATGDRADGGG